LVVVYSYIPQIIFLQLSSMTGEEESKSRHSRLSHLTHDHSHTSSQTHNLSLLSESLGEAAHVRLEVALVAEELDVGTVDLDLALLALLEVLLTAERGETPALGDDDLLATGELWAISI
jgi:hypothetical protein